MSWRSIILGLFGAAALSAVTYFNDEILKQTMLVGNLMPIAVYGSVILFVLLLNPLLARLHPRLPLSGKELAVAMAVTLAACVVPGSGLMRTFTSSLIMPHHLQRQRSGWQQADIVGQAPEGMLVDITADENRILNGYIQGLATADRQVGVGDLPWSAWRPALQFWLPAILLLWLALLGLSLVLHRQWARHEHLPYPLATFASHLLPGAGSARAALFGQRIFWIGAGAVLFIHGVNYLHAWFPDQMIHIPRSIDFSSLVPMFPTFERGGGGMLGRPVLFFTVAGFAYFLASDVSLSLGVAPFIYLTLVGVLAGYGISVGGGYMSPTPQSFLAGGAFTGMLLAILYTGRHYYARAAAGAFLPAGRTDAPPEARWGVRVFLLALALFVIHIRGTGLPAWLGLLYALGTVMIFVVMARMIAEAGLFFMQPYLFPCVLLWGLFGPQALGPRLMLIMFLLSTVLLADPREAFMPFIVNSLRLADLKDAPLRPVAAWSGAAVLVALMVAIPVTLYLQYNHGAAQASGWATQDVPRFPFEEALRVQQRLEAQEMLDTSLALGTAERIGAARPDARLAVFFGAGLVLVGLFALARLRLSKWPLHPVLFLVWHTYPGRIFAASFLVGWAIKAAVMKYGGAHLHQKLKPLMIGLIAGDMLGGVTAVAFNLSWHLLRTWLLPGLPPPPTFNILAA